MTSAILLVAHGSRRPEANADLVELAKLFQQRFADEIIEVGYLELTEPTIPDGLRNCAERGATSVSILPYFLSHGAHVTEDLVEFQEEFRKESPKVDCCICPPIGLHEKIVDVMLQRLSQGRERHAQKETSNRSD